MKIIFDSGSTSVSYTIVAGDSAPQIHTLPSGHNAASAPDGALAELLSRCDTITTVSSLIGSVDFYGAGCSHPAACSRVKEELQSIFPSATIRVESDMLCAARALCGDKPGIACILGTGANSCLWDGSRITANVSPMGFILGDEGSGAVIGRLFLGLMFKGQFPECVATRFHEKYNLSRADIIESVYRGARPGAFLASFAPFILEEAGRTPEVAAFIIGEFRRFLRFNVASYDNTRSLPVCFAGSIAWHFRSYLSEAVAEEGFRLGRILKSPIEALAAYSLNTVQ